MLYPIDVVISRGPSIVPSSATPHGLLSPPQRMNYRNAVQDAVSMHHRRIDDFVVQWLSEQPTGSRRQIVCMGAGLDARPYRMKQLAEEQVDWYELDVPEVCAPDFFHICEGGISLLVSSVIHVV